MSLFKATSTYGKGFKKTDIEDQYSIRIYTGGTAGVNTASDKVQKEADQFLVQSNYKGYETVEVKRIWFPFTCVKFTLQFHS